MSTWALLATGASMSQELADRVRHMPRVAVSNARELAPDADALASSDAAWWRVHPQALQFPGRRFTVAHLADVERIPLATSTNSGLLAMHAAVLMGATRLLLLGYDLTGTHYFGPHPEPLANTTPDRFVAMRKQFARWTGCPVVNCTPGSALECFPRGDIEDFLC